MFRDHGHNDNIRGVFLHVFGDFLGSIGVMITAIVYKFTNWKYKMYIDPVFSVIIVAMLVHGCYDLFRNAAQSVIERCPDSVDCAALRQDLLGVEGVQGVHELHVWELGKDGIVAMIHLVVTSKRLNQMVQREVSNKLIVRGIFSSTVQVEFLDEFPAGVDAHDACSLAASVGKGNRVFLTPAAYQHAIGCPHVNVGGDERSSSHDSGDNHDHGHHHDRAHEHVDSGGAQGGLGADEVNDGVQGALGARLLRLGA
jgi:hypothetical protein